MSRPTTPTSPRRGKLMIVKVLMLDNTVNTFQIPHKASGKVLYEDVVNKLQLLEADYFDLEYINAEGIACWLDHDKPVLKQVGSPHELNFRFGVKFYTPDPGLLEDEYTRYLFALQIKRDLQTGLMPCNENTAALLASYITQAELGDFIDEFTDQSYFNSCKIMQTQTPKLEEKIIDHHKVHVGMTPADADFNLLDTARKVEMYGIKMCSARVSTDHEACGLNLATAHMGVLVFQNYTKINTFSWAKIRKLSFKRKKFLIKLHPEGYGFYKDTVEFYFETRNECKNFWKKCIEHHAFFRCQAVKRLPRNKTRVVSRGSSFRYGGRTQKQLVEWVRENHAKRVPFDRSASARASSRNDSTRTNTLNSADLHHSHNSTSSGSHTLDATYSKDNLDRVSRVETVDIHSSHSSVGSPKRHTPDIDRRSLDRRSIDSRRERERSERSLDRRNGKNDSPLPPPPPPPPPPPLQDEQGTKPESVSQNYPNCDQNANDNVEIVNITEKVSAYSPGSGENMLIQSESSNLSDILNEANHRINDSDMIIEKTNEINIEKNSPRDRNRTSYRYNIPEPVLDDDKSLQKEVSVEDNQAIVVEEIVVENKTRNIDSDTESIRSNGSRPGSRSRRVPKVQRSTARQQTGDSMEDIPYVLHRIQQTRPPVEFIKTSNQTSPLIKPQKRYVNTVPPREKLKKRAPPVPKKSPEAKRIHEAHLKQIKTTLQNPPDPTKSPGRTRGALNAVLVHQLPSPNSFSCKDDSMSPSLEKQILEHLKQKQKLIQKAERSITPRGATPQGMKRTSPLLRNLSISDDDVDDDDDDDGNDDPDLSSVNDLQKEALLEALEHEQFIRGLAPIGEVPHLTDSDSSDSEVVLEGDKLGIMHEYLNQERFVLGLSFTRSTQPKQQYSISSDDYDEITEVPPVNENDVYTYLHEEALQKGLPPVGAPPLLDINPRDKPRYSISDDDEVELPPSYETALLQKILEQEAKSRNPLPRLLQTVNMARRRRSDETDESRFSPKASCSKDSIPSFDSSEQVEETSREELENAQAILEEERARTGLPCHATFPAYSRHSTSSIDSADASAATSDDHSAHILFYFAKDRSKTDISPTEPTPRMRYSISSLGSEDHVEMPPPNEQDEHTYLYLQEEIASIGLPPIQTTTLEKQHSITDSEDEVVETPSATDLSDSVRHFFHVESSACGLPQIGTLPIVDEPYGSDSEPSPPLPPPPRFSISEEHGFRRQMAMEEDYPPPPIVRRDSGRRWSEDSLPPPPPPPLPLDSVYEMSMLSLPRVTIQAATPLASEDEDSFTPVPEEPTSSGIDTSESEEEVTQENIDLVDFFERRFESIEHEIDTFVEASPHSSHSISPVARSIDSRSDSDEIPSSEGIPLSNGVSPRREIHASDLSESDDEAPAYDDNLYTLESLDQLNHPDMMHYSSDDEEDLSSDCGSEELLNPSSDIEEDDEEEEEEERPSIEVSRSSVRDIVKRFSK